MRSIVFLIFLFHLLSGSTCFSQVSFGVKTGAQLGWLAPKSGNETSQSGFGGYLGGYSRITMRLTGIYFQPELLYAYKGSSVKRDIPGGTQEEKVYLHSFQLPIGIGKSFIAGKIRVQVGLIVDLFIGKRYVQDSKISGLPTYSANITQDLNNLLLSYQVGLGTDYQKFTFDLRYESGLSPLNNQNNLYKPNAIAFYVGYKIK